MCLYAAVPSDPHGCSGKTRRKLSHADCRLSLTFREQEHKKIAKHLHDKQVERHRLPQADGCQVVPLCCVCLLPVLCALFSLVGLLLPT